MFAYVSRAGHRGEIFAISLFCPFLFLEGRDGPLYINGLSTLNCCTLFFPSVVFCYCTYLHSTQGIIFKSDDMTCVCVCVCVHACVCVWVPENNATPPSEIAASDPLPLVVYQ